MKTIGLLGGMSWESTLLYYQIINETMKESLGGLHSAKVVLNSVDFHEIEQLQHSGKWDETAVILSEASKSIEKAGADFLLICTNTMHKVALDIQKNIDIPILHIADATAKKLKADGISKVGLLGTAFTMEQEFYKQRLEKNFGIEVLVPNKKDREIIHKIIYEELCLGIIKDSSRKQYLQIMDNLALKEAQGIILGCTEIGLLIKQENTKIKLYDTTKIHAKEAVIEALRK